MERIKMKKRREPTIAEAAEQFVIYKTARGECQWGRILLTLLSLPSVSMRTVPIVTHCHHCHLVTRRRRKSPVSLLFLWPWAQKDATMSQNG